MEGTAKGKMVLGSRSGGIPEMIDDEITGFLFESRNEKDIAVSIKKLYQLTDLEYKEMVRATLEKAKKMFDEQTYITKLEAIYSSIICKKE